MENTAPCPGYAKHALRLLRALGAIAGTLCCSLGAFAAQADLSHGGSAFARFLDVTNPYVFFNYAYDSNVLRLDDVTPAEGGRADEIGTLALGFNSDIESSRQLFRVNGEFDAVRYNNHDRYDHQGGRFAAIWHWTGTDALTGTAGYRFRRSLRDFANEFSSERDPNRPFDMRTENRVEGSADLILADNWKTGVRGDFADITFTETPGLNLRKTTAGASITYVSHAANELGFDLEGIHGNYVNNSGSDFNEYTVGPTLLWKFTIRTQMDASVGYTQRDYSAGQRFNYGGVTGHVTFTIADAGRGSLVAKGYREVSNLTDEIPDYAIVDGVSIEPGWTLSNSMTFRLHGSYEHRDFRNAGGVTARLDDVAQISGFLDWPIGRHIKLTAGLTTERRSSTRLYQDYEYLKQEIQITGLF